MTTGYCVKCKASREMSDTKSITMKNGRPAIKGKCPKCGTGMFRIGDGSSKGSSKKKKTGSSRKSRRSHKSRH